MRVKFCGITSLEDAELCAAHGAWALGMIFVPASPRACSPEAAARIAPRLRRRVELAGVFANAPLEEVTSTVDGLALSLVQLHGDEGATYCDVVTRRTGVPVMKATRVRSRADAQALMVYRSVGFHLMDGAGEPFDWELARTRRSSVPLVLAGGLSPENVAAAIAATGPYAVDVARGTEASPGVKDPEKVAAFAAAAAGADEVAA